jgi:TnpA family transposase
VTRRYPVGVQAPDAQRVARYSGRGRGITFHVWTSDQRTHDANRVVRMTVHAATYVRDGILDNQTDAADREAHHRHAGDSDLVFTRFDLLGL